MINLLHGPRDLQQPAVEGPIRLTGETDGNNLTPFFGLLLVVGW